jgi:ribonuclease R
LVGEQTGARFPLGMRVEVRLEEATPVSGGLLFTVLSDPQPPAPGWKRKSHHGHKRQFHRGKRRR